MPLPRYVWAPLGVVCASCTEGWGMVLIVPGISLVEGSTVWKMVAEKTWLSTGKEACAFQGCFSLGGGCALVYCVQAGPAHLSSPNWRLPGAEKEGMLPQRPSFLCPFMGPLPRPLPAPGTRETPSCRTTQSSAGWRGWGLPLSGKTSCWRLGEAQILLAGFEICMTQPPSC